MNDTERAESEAKAQATIDREQYVVCVCGQLFYDAEKYVEHRQQCQHVVRARA